MYLQRTRIEKQNKLELQVADLQLQKLLSIEIPKMLIKGFAENSVKTAFHGIDYKGRITFSVSREQ